jgi:hypothetical protein
MMMMLADGLAVTTAIVPANPVIVNQTATRRPRTAADLCATCVLTVDEQICSGD